MTGSRAEPTQRRAATLTRRVVRWLGVAVLLLVLAFVVFYAWASSGDADERELAPGLILRAENPTAAPTGVKTLRVMTFNIGYGRGPAGDASGPWTEAQIKAGLDGIAAQIGEHQADLVFLQEIDLDAARTHHLDEPRYLMGKTGLSHASCVVTWHKHYVPFPYWPPSRHYGAMKSGQCILSRFPLAESTRHRLPQPESSPFWRNAFYLHRALDHAKVTIDGATWHLVNVHLEAFDVPNRRDHAQRLAALVAQIPEAERARLIVAGDFNAPPPEAEQKKGFVDEPETDFTGDDTIEIMRKTGLAEVLPDPRVVTFPADAPTRRLDYIFHGQALARVDAAVLAPPPGPYSDHLPVFASFDLR